MDYKKLMGKLNEEHLVHVNDGSNYGDKPHPKDVEHVMAGAKKHNGEHDGNSDKGAFFKFKSHSDAQAFKKHVDSAPHKSVYADLNEGLDIIARADYKLNKAGKKSHKEIVFHNGDSSQEKDDKLKREEVELDETAWGKDKMTNLRQAHDRHMEKAVAANKTGDNEAVKTHQRKMQMIKTQMQKHKQNEDVELDEKLNPSMGAGEYIKDFQKSDAPQFKGKTKEKKRMMGIAAYMAAKKTMKEEVKKDEPPFDGPYTSSFKKPNNPNRTGMDSARSLAQRALDQVKKKPVKEESHQSATTMKHIPNPSPALKKAAKDIKPGIAGYRDRIAMLKAGGVKEEVEELDELSKTTLGSYAKKASRDAVITRKIGADFENQADKARSPGMKAASNELSQKYKSKSWKRRDGVDKAVDRLTKEETVVEAKDEQEYGYEGDMAMTQLETAIRHATYLKDMLKPETDLPEWVQSKITLATDYLQTACDYMTSEMNEALKGNQHKIDKNKNGKVDAHDFKLLQKEEQEITEATVKTQKYSWGTMKTVHQGSDFSIPLHPEHHEAIAKLKDQQEHKFKTEDGKHWTAKRSGDDVHFQGANGGSSTKVPHKSISEAFINGREYASHGLMHPDHAASAVHKVTGSTIDFYAHGSGDKVSGKVTKNDGKAVHIKDTSGKTHRFEVSTNLPKQQNEEVQIDESKNHAAEYDKHMGNHYDAAEKGDWDKAEVHAEKAETAATRHFKATGKKIYDPGYTGSHPHVTSSKVNEETGKAPVAPVPDRKYIKGTPENKALKASRKPMTGHPTKVKEGTNFDEEGNLMAEKKTYSQFVEQLLEYESDKEGVYRHTKGSYGKSYDSEDDDKPSKAEPSTVKRGRGRPAGAKSGANQKVSSGKSYGGIATHTLNLPK